MVGADELEEAAMAAELAEAALASGLGASELLGMKALMDPSP